MKVRLPYSKKKRYLTGIDWIIVALDSMNRRATGGTNASQIVLELSGAVDDNRFCAAVAEFTQLFPVLGGRSTRCWNLAPYWKMPRPGKRVPVTVETFNVAAPEILSALERSVNTAFAEANEHLAFRVFHAGADHHYIAMHFNHRLFDAQGAEAFLDLFHSWYRGEDCRARIERIALTEPAHLCDWKRKFEAGTQLVRMLREFAKTPPLVLPRPSPLKGRSFKFSVMEFNGQEAKAINDRACRESGFLMFLPYALASAVQVLDAAFHARGAKGQDYIVSVSVDMRTPDTAAARLFFNNVSFLFFRVSSAIAGNRKQVMETVRTQMYEQIKSGFPRALHESSMVMRILPASVLSRLLLWPLNGEFASLGLTCVGKGGDRPSKFMDADVVNLFHMPLVPVPPGIGFFVNQFGDRMNVVLSYVDGMLSDADVQQFRADIRRWL